MGRTSLMMVIGFNVIFMTMGFNLSRYATDAYIKYSSYYQIEQAQYIAQSATNIALSNLYTTNLANPGTVWSAPTGTITLANGGTFTIVIDSTLLGGKDTIQVRMNATYAGIQAQTIVDYARASFTDYAMYNVNENGIYWITGDTCWGDLHTQDYLYVSGNPYFKGRVTTGKGLSKKNGAADHPVFDGGYRSGVNQPLPGDVTDVKTLGRLTGASGGKDWVHSGTYPTPALVEILFKGTGQIYVTVTPQTGVNGSGNPILGTPVTTLYPNITALSPNGVLLVENMPVRVKGVLNGNVTIGSVGTGSKVYIDSSIAYSQNPKLPDGSPNPACTSTLGIVAVNDVMVTDNTDNNNGVTIDASIFSLTGGFGAENYTSRGIDGELHLVGAIQAKDRNPVGTFSGSGTLASGFQKNYDYDTRLKDNPPAGYPKTANFEVRNWYESITKYPNIFDFLNP